MKNFEFHNRVIGDVIAKLNELDIDLFLIITSEGSDRMTRFIPGVDTVGSGRLLLHEGREKIRGGIHHRRAGCRRIRLVR